MRYIIISITCLTLVACAGRNASPIQIIQYGDSALACEELIGQMAVLDSQARKKLGKESRKTGKNVGLGVAGAFLLVPLFFMDFSEADRIEAEALRDRYLHLQRLAQKNKCEF